MLLGIVCAAVAIAVAQLVAGLVDPDASPIVAVGGTAIDATPEWLKSFAIRTFGSNDKAVLLAAIGIVLTLIAALLGIAAMRRPWIGFPRRRLAHAELMPHGEPAVYLRDRVRLARHQAPSVRYQRSV